MARPGIAREMQDAQPRIKTGPGVQEAAAAVGRGIVHGDHLDRRARGTGLSGMAEQRVEARRQVIPDAVHRHDDADQRRLRQC